MHIEVIPNPSKDEVWWIRRNLQEYNLKHLEVTEEQPFVIFALEEGNFERLGGIACTIFGQWIDVEYLWVREDKRGQGIGSTLLDKALERAKEAGCSQAWLSTFSFQDPEFYLRKGFKTVFVQSGYPRTSSRSFLVRDLRLPEA